MQLQDFYPMIVTEHLGGCRDFYRRQYARFQAGKATIVLELRDEPFGQRRFGLFDPAGVWIDIVEQIEPAPGWQEPYLPRRAEA